MNHIISLQLNFRNSLHRDLTNTYTVFISKVISRIIINILRCVRVVVTFHGMPSGFKSICVNTEQAQPSTPPTPIKAIKRNQQNNVFKTVEGNTKIRNYSGF